MWVEEVGVVYEWFFLDWIVVLFVWLFCVVVGMQVMCEVIGLFVDVYVLCIEVCVVFGESFCEYELYFGEQLMDCVG